VWQNDELIPVKTDVDTDGQTFRGLSWAAGEIRRADLKGEARVIVKYSVTAESPVQLEGRVYFVRY
jgi:hypothetical protein